jgi:hypothetical protein
LRARFRPWQLQSANGFHLPPPPPLCGRADAGIRELRAARWPGLSN